MARIDNPAVATPLPGTGRPSVPARRRRSPAAARADRTLTIAALIAVGLTLSWTQLPASAQSDARSKPPATTSQPADGPPAAGSAAAQSLRESMLGKLAAGSLDEAVSLALSAVTKLPNDAGVRAECVSLLLAVARQSLTNDDFASADRALAAVLRIEPADAGARRLSRSIAEARSAADGRVREARGWIDVEWHEPAFRAIGQAIALVPERGAEWTPDYIRAAVGAGDDHYFTKNFRDAFYCYDAAIRLSTEGATSRPVSPSLAARWMQSMVFALADDVDRATFSPDFWRMTLRRVNALPRAATADAELRAMVQALAAEDLGDPEQAASGYGRVAGAATVVTPDQVKNAKLAAIQRLRGFYDPGLSDRRGSKWTGKESGDWRVKETPGFRIHHRNDRAARRVAAALAFHQERIAGLLGRKPAEVGWAVPCDIWLYADAAAYAASVKPSGSDVLASSVINLRGGRLESHAIHTALTDPMLLSSTLAHELAHLMVGAATDYRPLPGALAEGLALAVEPRCRQIQFNRVWMKLDKRRDLTALLAVRETHPAEPGFYAEAERLVLILSAKSGLAPLLRLKSDPPDAAEIARAYQFPDAAALSRAYLGK